VEALWKSWRHPALVVAVFLGVLGAAALRYAAPSQPASSDNLVKAVAKLNAELQQLHQERQMPALVVSRSSGSICYIYADYDFEHGHGVKTVKVHISGTGFVVGDGLIATNRHVAEPWWGDPHLEAAHKSGASTMKTLRLLAFFPGESSPIPLSHVMVSGDADLAVARFDPELARRNVRAGVANPPRPLPLADNDPLPGDAVLVLGFPMGIEGLLAKSPRGVVRRLAMQHDDLVAVKQLADLALIRPSATQGHLGDAVGDKLLYDAATAQGASGSPVFNASGEVIGVNTAFLDGFSGGGIGISAKKLRQLVDKAASEKR
jgi:S1-C subfamily serine protease